MTLIRRTEIAADLLYKAEGKGQKAPRVPKGPKKNCKEEMQPVANKIAELNESQSELLGRLRGLKESQLIHARIMHGLPRKN